VLVLAAGGTLTELVDDAVVVVLPADASRVEAALGRLRIGRLLGDRKPVVELAAALVAVAESADLALLELNPVVVGPDSAVAVDAVARRAAPHG
jgi:succinyl-CoA synthetase beta subunit